MQTPFELTVKVAGVTRWFFKSAYVSDPLGLIDIIKRDLSNLTGAK